MVKRFIFLATITSVFVGTLWGSTPSKHNPSSKSNNSKPIHRKASRRGRAARKGAWKRHGQQRIDSARATEIQQALIREKYLNGDPTGNWDSRTEAAMSRYQADHGWQSKVTPDSRALIKLGLGPNHQSDLPNSEVRSGTDAFASTGSAGGSPATKP
jgi:peptidoglycan hydrolase-like protein with peptidoglycan-binding domain